MIGNAQAFTVGQTHGILSRTEHEIESSSDQLGWSSLYVSMQHERPYKDSFAAVDDHLIIVHRDGPVRVQRWLGKHEVDRVVQPGGLFVLPAQYEFAVELGGPLSTIHLYVRGSLVREAAEELGLETSGLEIQPRLGEHDPLIEHAAYAACELVRGQVRGDWVAESLGRTLAVQLACHHSNAALKSAPRLQGLPARRLRLVIDFIDANLSDAMSLSDMAAAVALSPIHFARQFKKSTGQSPYQYLLGARIEAAKRLLRSDLAIAEIAFRCGFSHQEHLTRIFGRMVGVTPAAYRRSIGT